MSRTKGTTARAGALALLLAASMSGCENFLDVNTDPNNPEQVPLDLTLSGMLAEFGHEVLAPTDQRYGNLLGPSGWGPEWIQQWAWNGQNGHTYAQFQLYEVANLDTNGWWQSSYADVMQEAVNIMRVSEETGQGAYHGIAKFIYSWNAALLTDAFGPIPLSQAFDPSNPTPGYDTQQEVYRTVFRLIDEAIAEMHKAGPNPPGRTDLLYGGDMAMWVKLANTVKARLHMRLAYAPGENTAERAESALRALADGIASSTDAPTINYTGGPGSRQPWFHFNDQGYNEPSRAAEFLVELLKSTSDPRLPIMVRPADLQCPAGEGYARTDCKLATTTIYRGLPAGATSGQPDSAISRIGTFFSAGDAPHVWITYEDTKFLEAEARLVTSGPAAAEAPYRAAVRANMVRLRVPAEKVEAYLASLPPLTSVANPLEAIITQKYLANFLRDEVWHDWRRTGFPRVTPVDGRVIDGIPQRLRTPGSEMQFNAESLTAAGVQTSLEGMLEKVWWASGSPPK